MGRRTTTAMVLGTALTLLTACGPDGCTAIAGSSEIRIQVPGPIQKVAPTLRVELCQADRCDSIDFKTKPNSPSEGISRNDSGTYQIDLNLFDTRPKAGTESRLNILGFSKKNRMVLRRTERFEFDAFYPNGKDCDPEPSLRHSTSVDGEDLIG